MKLEGYGAVPYGGDPPKGAFDEVKNGFCNKREAAEFWKRIAALEAEVAKQRAVNEALLDARLEEAGKYDQTKIESALIEALRKALKKP